MTSKGTRRTPAKLILNSLYGEFTASTELTDIKQTIIYVSENFCDRYCKYPVIITSQHRLDSICKNCPMNKLTDLLKEDEN